MKMLNLHNHRPATFLKSIERRIIDLDFSAFRSWISHNSTIQFTPQQSSTEKSPAWKSIQLEEVHNCNK